LLTNQNILITGGAGVIGSELIPKLLERGANLLVADKKPRPPEWGPRIRYRCGDLNSLESYELTEFAPRIVIHLAAAFERSIESSEFWSENFDHNIQLSHRLITVLGKIKSVERIIFASSYLVYDPGLYLESNAIDAHETKRLAETDTIQPRNLTGAAKLFHETELKFFQRTSSTPISLAIARIFRGYGRGSRDVISRWVRAAVLNETIDVYRAEGRFDYVYAADSAEALARLAESRFEGTINIGTGKSRRVEDVVSCIREYFPNLAINYLDSNEQVENSEADISLLYANFNWVPSFTLEEGITEIISYEQSHRIDLLTKATVLVSSAGDKIPLLKEIERDLSLLSGDITVIAADSDASCLSASSKFRFLRMPSTEDSNVEQILNQMIEHKINLIIPTRDGELEFYSRNVEKFLYSGIHIAVSPIRPIEICSDKLLFFNTLKDDYPVIPTSDSLDSSILGDGPYVVKERFGAGSNSLGLSLNRESALLHASRLRQPIFQTFVTGTEFSVDAYVQSDGRVKGCMSRSRDRVVSGESRVTTLVHDLEIENIVSKLVKHLGLRGHVLVQIIRNQDGIKIVECNPRVGGASTLSMRSGLHSTLWSLVEALNLDIDQFQFIPDSRPLRQFRIPTDVTIDSGS